MIVTSSFIILFSIVAGILLCFGILGMIYYHHNLLMVLMSIELMLLGINFNFNIYSFYLSDYKGQLFSLFILVISAAESAIGLIIFINYYQVQQSPTMLNISFGRR